MQGIQNSSDATKHHYQINKPKDCFNSVVLLCFLLWLSESWNLVVRNWELNSKMCHGLDFVCSHAVCLQVLLSQGWEWVHRKWAATDSRSSESQSLCGDSQCRRTSGKKGKDKHSIHPLRNQLLERESDNNSGLWESWHRNLRVTRNSSPQINRML